MVAHARVLVAQAFRPALWLALATAPLFAQSQSTELHIRFKSGQPIVPIYEGWERVPDGTFNMVFGYLNRNHVEQPIVQVGPQNGFDPGPADRGQPTVFYPRENHFLFKVNVPQDWDRKKELVWTLTVNGKTEQAKATLLDVWEIDRKVEVSNNGGVQTSNDLINKDQPPVVTIDPIARPKAGASVTISASVTDDGIPVQGKPRTPRPLEPSLRGAPPSPVNVPMPQRPRPVPGGLSVLWLVYRGPAAVAFDPEGYTKVVDGKVSVKAIFPQAGTYTLRAFGHDGILRAPADVTVTVDP
jgi:hypothetical protein